ncbi:MAG: cytochrome C oxidase subunit IV family protein [Myxococcales bacterium]
MPHPVRASVLVRTAATLLALTALTVAASRLDLGRFSVLLALAIAALKASIVALFFMHLRYEGRFRAVVLVVAVAFAALFAGAVVFDTTQYQPGIVKPRDTLP